MKKLYLLSTLIFYSFFGYSQTDCASAVTIAENTEYIKTLVPFEYQWYKFTIPRDGKLQIEYSNSDNAQIELLSGSCGSLTDLGGGLGLISYLEAAEGEEVYLRLSTFELSNQDITFSLEVNDIVEGDSCDDPITAVKDTEGVNTIPPTLNQFIWFQFQMPAEEKILTISNPLNSRIEVYGENCTEFRASNFFNQNDDLVTQNPRPNEVINIKFTLDGTGDVDWNLSLDDFAAGEKCDLAEIATDGINSVPSSNAPFFWFSYTIPAEGGRLEVTSSVDNNVHVYRNACDALEFLGSGNGNIFLSSLDPEEQVLIRWNLSDGNNFDWNIATQAFLEGDICSNAKVAIEGQNILTEDNYADYWYSFEILNNNATVSISPNSSFFTYEIYKGSCGDFTKLLDGFGNEEVTNLSANDEIFIKWNIRGTKSLDFDLDYSYEKQDQEIIFNNLDSKTFGDANFDLTASASSDLDVGYSSSNTAVATVIGSTVTIVGAGTTTITASQDGNTEFNAAEPVEQILTVNKADQTITLDPITNKLVSDADFEINGSSTSGLNLSYSVTGPATVSGNFISFTWETGTVVVTASQAGNDNYNAAQDVTQEFLVTDPNKTNQTITFDALPAVSFGGANFDLSGSASSGRALTYESSNPNVATISGSTVTVVGAGTATITASQEGDGTYNPASPVSQELVVNKANQTISITAISDKEVTAADFDVTASTASGLALIYEVSGPASISGNTITLEGTVGTVTVTVSQSGNANYNSASAQVSFEVINSRSDQTISITSIPDKFTTDSSFDVEASTTSELDLTYEVSGPATIEGTSITLDGTVGTVEVTVSQAGNDDFNPATESVSFDVTEDPCLDFTVTATVTNSVCAGDDQGIIVIDPTAGTAPFSYSLNEADAVRENIFTTLAPGEYSVVVTDANGCTATATATITSPDPLEITAEVVNSNSILGNGSISLSVTGGTGEYTYSWSNDATTASIEELEVGEYSVTVTDENGCNIEKSFTIGGVTANAETLSKAISIFPNPAKDIIQIEYDEEVKLIQLYDVRGKILNEMNLDGSKSEINVSQLPAGLYFIKMDGDNQLYRFIKE
ncbi:T9SS type A sorting domain-containing protein [Marivirga arenosa]|uniref:T9SS type A sorting domain-containing protein n=1 Tax=Marivirga arenosa TaxID=3059076 RepID=A0AA51ZX87_9BACT|nr:T9SS type A sorting domain-containing protein [Marivirga sp. BKB1-2]WNB18465.1 T9SS type A sorting domain-containing protein [Marivirga sp. BKB1-2]